ncbi:hypothetical protein G3260_001746 [Streptomyces albus]|uniref:hypothetical protein n=1 Tax=Streptomyces albus TaxID=1888 RepID=UPI0013B48232|nr:hypothetical protein [Streptomyces albus]QID35730.1 hypothetical protein G3260_001746 [Streptomyces albus]
MALRKSTMKKQVAEAIAQQAPGDRPLVSVGAVAGPTPWLSVGFLGLIGQFLIKYYFITVTEQALLLHRMSRFSQRPKEIVHAIPRDQARTVFGEIQLNPLWSFYHMALPGEAKPVRINVHRMWRNELEELLAVVNNGPAPQGQAPGGLPPQGYPSQPAPGQPQPQQPGPQHQPYAQPQQGQPYPQPQQQGQPYAQPQQGQPQQGQPYAQPQAPQPHQPYAQPQAPQAPNPYQQPQAPQAPQGPPQPNPYQQQPQAPQQPGPYGGQGGQQGGAPVDPRTNPYG